MRPTTGRSRRGVSPRASAANFPLAVARWPRPRGRVPRASPRAPRVPPASHRPMVARGTSGSSRPSQHSLHAFGERGPALFDFLQTLPTQLGEAILPRPPAIRGYGPLGIDQSRLVETMERGIEGSFLDAKQSRGGLLDEQRNPESVIGTRGEGLEDQQFQCGLWIFSTVHVLT